MGSVTTQLRLEVVECASCRLPFAVSELVISDRRRDHANFFCPLGHTNFYPGKSDVEKLQDQLSAARELAEREGRRRRTAEEQRDHEERSARAYRGHVTRLKRRLGAGRCPCCSQEFPDVAEHLAAEHPGYADVDEHAAEEATTSTPGQP